MVFELITTILMVSATSVEINEVIPIPGSSSSLLCQNLLVLIAVKVVTYFRRSLWANPDQLSDDTGCAGHQPGTHLCNTDLILHPEGRCELAHYWPYVPDVVNVMIFTVLRVS